MLNHKRIVVRGGTLPIPQDLRGPDEVDIQRAVPLLIRRAQERHDRFEPVDRNDRHKRLRARSLWAATAIRPVAAPGRFGIFGQEIPGDQEALSNEAFTAAGTLIATKRSAENK